VGDFNMSNLENRNPKFSVLISNGLDYITKSLPYVYFFDDDDNNFDDDDDI
jgi:hypothetical protein